MFTKDQQGLYDAGNLVAISYLDSLKYLYQLENIPDGFCVNEDYEAKGYSVVDSRGVQHIYELSPKEFYNALMELQ
jgi:predicted transcriptional regulator